MCVVYKWIWWHLKSNDVMALNICRIQFGWLFSFALPSWWLKQWHSHWNSIPIAVGIAWPLVSQITRSVFSLLSPKCWHSRYFRCRISPFRRFDFSLWHIQFQIEFRCLLIDSNQYRLLSAINWPNRRESNASCRTNINAAIILFKGKKKVFLIRIFVWFAVNGFTYAKAIQKCQV